MLITSCDPIIFRSTKHWTGHRSPIPLLDLDVAKLVEVSSVSGVGGSRSIPFEDRLLDPRICGCVRRRRRVNGGPSLSLPSVSAASAVSALRVECARPHVEPSEGGVLADVSQAALEISSCSTRELSSTAGLALFRSWSSIGCG
jgi:hypothetical protein